MFVFKISTSLWSNYLFLRARFQGKLGKHSSSRRGALQLCSQPSSMFVSVTLLVDTSCVWLTVSFRDENTWPSESAVLVCPPFATSDLMKGRLCDFSMEPCKIPTKTLPSLYRDCVSQRWMKMGAVVSVLSKWTVATAELCDRGSHGHQAPPSLAICKFCGILPQTHSWVLDLWNKSERYF